MLVEAVWVGVDVDVCTDPGVPCASWVRCACCYICLHMGQAA